MTRIKSKALSDAENRLASIGTERDAFRQWIVADLLKLPVTIVHRGNIRASLFGLDSPCGGWIVWVEDLGDGYPFIHGDMVDAFDGWVRSLEYSPNPEVQARTDCLRYIAGAAHQHQAEAMDRKYGKVSA